MIGGRERRVQEVIGKGEMKLEVMNRKFQERTRKKKRSIELVNLKKSFLVREKIETKEKDLVCLKEKVLVVEVILE